MGCPGCVYVRACVCISLRRLAIKHRAFTRFRLCVCVSYVKRIRPRSSARLFPTFAWFVLLAHVFRAKMPFDRNRETKYAS